MSDSESYNTSNNNNESDAPSTIIEALLKLCKSDELSIASLRDTINRPGLSHIYNGPYDHKHDPDKTLFVVHYACMNENVTLEIIEFLLNNNIKSFPDAAQVLSTEFLTRQGDETSISETYPLHIACSNEHCPGEVIRFLVELYPPACEHLSNINGGVHYDAYQAGGLPFHYYLAQNKNVDIDTVKLFVEMYPQSLMIQDEEDDIEEACYPIHAILSNEKTNNIHEILSYMLELEPSSIQLLDARGRTPLHIACRNDNMRLVHFTFNKWPEAIRSEDGHGFLPIHILCCSIKMNDDASLAILHFMMNIDATMVREIAQEGYLPLHLAAYAMSAAFCKVLISAYQESLMIESRDGSLPIHDLCNLNRRADAVDTIQYMLELYPESINRRDGLGYLPIHYAASKARHGRIDTMKLLLKHDPDAVSKKTTDGKGQLPLHLACRYCKRPEAIQVLYDAFPEAIVVLDGDRKMPLQLVKKGRSKVLKFFHNQYEYLKKFDDEGIMHSPDKNGWLPLHHALKDNVSLGTIKLLVRKALVSIRAADDKLAFPIHIACEFSSVKVVEYLAGESNKHILRHLDANKDSILHYACRGGNCEVVKYFLKNHSSLVALAEVNEAGELPLHLLCDAGRKDKVDIDSTVHIETIWLMLLSNPEVVMS